MYVQMKSLSDKKVTVSMVSNFSGKTNTMELPIRPMEFSRLINRWKTNGEYVQDVFPMLDDSQREFLISGVTPEEWDECFPD